MSYQPDTLALHAGQRATGLTPELVRLSVGLEDVRDLIADLDQALGEVAVDSKATTAETVLAPSTQLLAQPTTCKPGGTTNVSHR